MNGIFWAVPSERDRIRQRWTAATSMKAIRHAYLVHRRNGATPADARLYVVFGLDRGRLVS